MSGSTTVTTAQQTSASAADNKQCDQEGSTRVHVKNEDAIEYGATGDRQCIEFCFPEAFLQFVPAASRDTCVARGYTSLLEEGKVYQPPGSPSPLSLDIYGLNDEGSGSDDNSNDGGGYHGKDMNPSIFDEDGGRPCIDCPEYVSLDAADKLERIWTKILDYEYPELPTDWLHSRADRITTDSVPDRERVNMIFDRVSDERPPNFPRMLHEYGSIARVAFVPAQPLGSHAFTGFYGEGNELGIIRVTFCAPMDGAKLGLRVPFAFAAKFLRDGIHSSNILTCEQQGVEGAERDPSMFSVFKHVVSHIKTVFSYSYVLSHTLKLTLKSYVVTTQKLHTSATIPQPADRFFSLAQNQTGTLSVADILGSGRMEVSWKNQSLRSSFTTFPMMP